MTADDSEDYSADANADGTGDQSKARKRKERLEQNRISARESRKRKKTMIEELQRTVITLSRENKDLNERNEQLRRQLMEIGAKYPNVVPLQAIVGQGTAPASEQTSAPATTITTTNNNMAGAGDDSAAASGDGPASGGGGGVLSSLNPMNWMGGGGSGTNAADSSAAADGHQADV